MGRSTWRNKSSRPAIDSASDPLNRRFLDQGIQEGAEFVLAAAKAEIRKGSALNTEVKYLLDHGYRWAANNMSVICKYTTFDTEGTMLQPRIHYPSLVWAAAVLAAACQGTVATRSRLDVVVDSLKGAQALANCHAPVESFMDGKSPHQTCEGRVGDTTLAVTRDADGRAIAVVKHWRPAVGISLSAAMLGTAATIEKARGPGQSVCLSAGNERGRRWRDTSYTVSAFSTAETGEVGIAFTTVASPEDQGCKRH